VTDVFDSAQEREAELLADALRDQARRAGLSDKSIADSAEHCQVCEKAIPEARRRALPGVQTCVACQQELEHGLRRAAR